MMNAGARLDEIIHTVQAPAHLIEKPYLRPTYDEPEFVVRNVWRLYGGWYDGNPAHLKPAPEADLAAELAALAGGVEALARRALELADAGDFRLACDLAELAALAAPDDKAVHAARGDVFGRRAETEALDHVQGHLLVGGGRVEGRESDKGEWVDGEPGLPEAAEQWLDELDHRLAQAPRRGNRIIHADPVTAGTLPRLVQLVRGRRRPRLAPALARRDGEEVVKALADTALKRRPRLREARPVHLEHARPGSRLGRRRIRRLPRRGAARAGLGRRRDPGPLRGRRAHRRLGRATARVGLGRASAPGHAQRRPRPIVLKIRRPGISRTVAADAAYLLPLLGLLESRDERFKVANLRGTLVLMLRLFAQEVDLRLEATSAVQLAMAFERAGVDVQVPAPIPGLVYERVLGMEFVAGRVRGQHRRRAGIRPRCPDW